MLEVRNLYKVFYDASGDGGGFLALHDINFRVEDREFVSLLGPSGCGKTTLLRIIAGILSADRGEMLDDGVPIRGPGKDRCMVFQNFGLLPWRTVVGNVELGLELDGVDKAARQAKSQEAIDLVGLRGFENHFPHQVSGGMQQRVGLARALTKDPRYLLMDEPFGALDAQTRESLQEELLKIWSRTRNTVIFVTHSIDEAIYLSDRILVMDRGPGRMKEEVRVKLRRPRWQFDVKADPEFVRMRSAIYRSLQGERVFAGS
ncbi:MAG: ABC transporter ATP-binding protein [Nitrospinota bacterium]